MPNLWTMPPHEHMSTALNHLAAVEAYADSLGDEWSKDRPDAADIKFLTASIGRGLKLAEIHATLHMGTQLERLVDVVCQGVDQLERRGDQLAHWSGGKP